MVKYTDEELDKKLKEIREKDQLKIDGPDFWEKISGVFTEPAGFFNRLSYFKPNFLNWILPVLAYILIFSACEFLMLNNPDVRKEKFDAQYENMENLVNRMVEKGRLSRDEAGDILDKEYEKAKHLSAGPDFVSTLVFKGITTLLGFFIVVILLQFFMNLFFSEIYLIKKTMVVYGLAFLIFIPEVLIRTIVVFISGSYISVLNFSLFLEQSNIFSYILGNLNPFTIWFNLVVCIGLIETYRVKNKKKIYLLIFGSWFVLLAIGYFVMQQFTMLSQLAR